MTFLLDASYWWLGYFVHSCTKGDLPVWEGQTWFELSDCLSQDLQFLCPCYRSPTSPTPGEVRPRRLRGPTPTRLRSREGAGRRRADTWRPRGAGQRRAWGGIGWGSTGRAGGKDGDGCRARASPEPGRPEGRGDSDGSGTAVAWRPGMSRPTVILSVAAAAGVAGTLWSVCVGCKPAARPSTLGSTGPPSIHRHC